jgi:CBS domain-containing protein
MTYPHTCWPVLADDPVNSLMRWPVAGVDDTDSLAEVSRALAENEVGAVIVLHHGVLVGLVSERDLAAHLGTGGGTSHVTAGDLMSPDLVTVPPEAPLLEAGRLMREAHVRHLPVVSEGTVAGILSMRDLFEVLLRRADDEHRLGPGGSRTSVDVATIRQHRAHRSNKPTTRSAGPGGGGAGL